MPVVPIREIMDHAFAERYGGSGGGPVETMIVMEAFGRALALEPFLATVVLGGGFLRHGGSAEQCAIEQVRGRASIVRRWDSSPDNSGRGR